MRGWFSSREDSDARRRAKLKACMVLVETLIVLESSPLHKLKEASTIKPAFTLLPCIHSIAVLSPQQGTSMRSFFRDCDQNRDGKVSRKEFREALAKRGLTKDTHLVDDLFDRMDPDCLDELEYTHMDRVLRHSVQRPGSSLPLARARWLLPPRSILYVMGPAIKLKQNMRALTYVFRAFAVSSSFLKKRELERPRSDLAAQILEEDGHKDKLSTGSAEFESLHGSLYLPPAPTPSPRILQKAFRRAYSQLGGPFLLVDFPADEDQLLWLETEFGDKTASSAEDKRITSLTATYAIRGLLLKLQGRHDPQAVAQKLEAFLRAISIRETLESIELQKGEERTARDLATRQREYLAGASAHMMRCRKQEAREKAEQLDYLLSRTTAAWYAALSERQAQAPSGPAIREAGSSLDSPAPTCGLPRVKPEDRPKWKSIRNMTCGSGFEPTGEYSSKNKQDSLEKQPWG
ncbi:MAG: hypothetical protein SGPRY_000786 [Prymnesium sp.]